MKSFKRIKKECFWDIDLKEVDMLAAISGSDFRKKQYVFEKILLNSTKIFHDLNLFNKNELSVLLADVKVPQFNGAYVFRRKNLAEVYFLGAELHIDELKWTA